MQILREIYNKINYEEKVRLGVNIDHICNH